MMKIVGGILKLCGGLLVLANTIWLVARLTYPRDITRVNALLVFLPVIVIGIALWYVGGKVIDRCYLKESKTSSQQPAAQVQSEGSPSD